MDRFVDYMINHFHHAGIEGRSRTGIRLRLRIGDEVRPVWLPRRHVTLLGSDEVLIPQWLCEKARLTHVERAKILQP